jgi:phage/plasmid-like protein (TIGR03299 family)
MSEGSAIIQELTNYRKDKFMAHNLEMNGDEVAFALRGTPAWHNLANRIFAQDEDVTTQMMLDESKLSNWNVRLAPITEHIPAEWNDSSGAQYVIRNNPFNGGTDVLSVVGSRYKVVQNEDLFSFADQIHDADPNCRWESAGSLKNGKVVFGTVDIPRTMVLDPQGANDQTKLYLIVWTSHDGSVAVQAAITPVRVVCQNTLNLAMKSAKQSFKIRHTQTAEGKIQVARETLGLTLGYFDVFEKQAQELFKQEITDKQFYDIVKSVYPKPADDASKIAKTKWDNKVVLLDELYFNSPTNANIKGTKWGAFNALTERLDYFRSTRSNSSESKWASASGFDPVITAEKNKILQIVKSA